MKVCPKCGHVDPDYWLPSRWRIPEYCRIEDLQQDQTDLAEKLKNVNPMEPITDENYAYRMNEAGFVERIWIELFKAGGKSAFGLSREAHHFNPKFVHPTQKKLVEDL